MREFNTLFREVVAEFEADRYLGVLLDFEALSQDSPALFDEKVDRNPLLAKP